MLTERKSLRFDHCSNFEIILENVAKIYVKRMKKVRATMPGEE
jgi:hypothetical protein